MVSHESLARTENASASNGPLFTVARAVATATGEAFFRSLINHLGSSLEADFALIGELKRGTSGIIQTIATYSIDGSEQAFEYDLAGTPCEDVMSCKLCSIPSRVREYYPSDRELVEGGFEAYVGSPLFDSKGQVMGVMAVMFRRTLGPEARLAESTLQILAVRAASELERMRAESALRNTKLHYESLVEALPVGVFITDLSGASVFASDRAFEIVGISPQDARGLNWTGNLHPEDRERVERLWIEAVRRQLPFASEYRFVHPDGSTGWVFGQCVPERDARGEPIGFVGTITDITERKQAEQELRASKEHLRITLNSIGDAVIATDRQAIVTALNPVAERLTGWSELEALGQPLERVFRLVDEERHEPIPCPAIGILDFDAAADSPSTDFLVGRDGRERRIAENAARIRNSRGDVVGAVLVFRDVTAQRELEDQLRQSQKMEAVGQLAGGIAHDFNNLLQAIQGYTGLALEAADESGSIHDYLTEIDEASGRAASLVRQLLTFSRRESFQPRVLDLEEVVRNLINLLSRVLGEQVDLRLVAEEGGASCVESDPVQLEMILMNLCTNARDAMPEGGPITIRCGRRRLDADFCRERSWAREGDYVCLEVEDCGVGIAPDVLDRVFEPFFTTKEVGSGTGLGLSTVYAIVNRHEGLIHIESTPGRGTSVQVFLPATSETPAEPPQPEEPAGREPGDETILLAEDDELVRTLTVRVLESSGYKVLAASDGVEGLELFTRHREEIDIIVLDVVMPGMGGKQVLEAVRAAGCAVPILFTSGYSADALDPELMEDPGTSAIQKPHSPGELLTAIRGALARRCDGA